MKTTKILVIVLTFMVVLCACSEDDSGKTGQVTFSGTYGDKGDVLYTVKIDGKSGTCIDSDPAPQCGTISDEAVSFVLPAGTYAFEFSCRTTNWFDGSVKTEIYPSKKVTIPEGGCVSVRWD